MCLTQRITYNLNKETIKSQLTVWRMVGKLQIERKSRLAKKEHLTGFLKHDSPVHDSPVMIRP